METQIGYRSATQQTWKGDPIRTAVIRLRVEHPRASREKINAMLAVAAREDDDLLEAMAEYCGNNTQNAIEQSERRRASTVRPTPQEAAETKAEVRATVENIKAQILLLNLEMPNGKRMRYCTGAEMEKFGAGYRAIARKVGKTKRVGEVLDEKGVQALMAKVGP
jgi:soluble cytochrome b562